MEMDVELILSRRLWQRTFFSKITLFETLLGQAIEHDRDLNVFVNHFVNDFVNDFANDFVNNFVNKPPKPLGDEIVKMSKFLTDNAMKLMELFSHSVENIKNRE